MATAPAVVVTSPADVVTSPADVEGSSAGAASRLYTGVTSVNLGPASYAPMCPLSSAT